MTIATKFGIEGGSYDGGKAICGFFGRINKAFTAPKTSLTSLPVKIVE